MSRHLLLLGLLCAALAPVDASAARKPKPKPPKAARAPKGANVGEITFATSTRGFLEHGAADGFALGQSIELQRPRGKGKCVIDELAPKRAGCKGDVRVGDRYALPAKPPPAAEAEKVVPPPPPSSREELQARNAALAGAVHEIRMPEALPAGPRRFRASARLGHASWMMLSSADRDFHEELVAIRLDDAPIAGPVHLHADLLATVESTLPAASRYRVDAPARFYARRLELSALPNGGRLRLSGGRLWPVAVPGLSILDGAQVGVRGDEGTWEAGLFGGGMPELGDSMPRFSAWTAGLYGAREHVGIASKDDLPWDRTSLRLGALGLPDGGTRLEAEVEEQLRFGKRVELGASLRGSAGDVSGLTAIRLDAGARPVDELFVTGGLRWLDGAASEVPFDGVLRHADLAARWKLSEELSLGAFGGHAIETGAAMERTWVGPEAAWPKLFGDTGGLTVGYAEEFGTFGGRSAFAQAGLRPGASFGLLTRLSWWHDLSTTPDAASFDEAGLHVGADVAANDWLSIGATVAVRTGLPASPGELENGASFPVGLHGALAVKGVLP